MLLMASFTHYPLKNGAKYEKVDLFLRDICFVDNYGWNTFLISQFLL